MRRALRLLPLPLSIAVCLPAMADDKPLNWGLCPATDVIPAFTDAPTPVPGQDKAAASAAREQQPTDIEGDQLLGTTTVPQYEGNVALRRGDQFVGTDKLSFDTESGNYIADGNVRYQDASIRMVAKRAEGNQESDTHKITDIQYQLVSRRGNGDAESVDLQGAVGQMHRSTYTTCDPSQPVWKLSAPQIEVDNDEGFGTARNAVLRIGKVPVLWAPYFKFPIDDRRKTGLLFPQLGMSGRNGFDYTQPIYLNLAPNYDDTLMPRYMSRRGLMLDNEFRYLYNGGRGELLTAYIPNDKLRDRDRGRVMFSGYHNVDSHWQARANLAWVSDERYVEDFANRLVGVTASNLQSTVGLYGTGQNWTAGIMADRWQLTDYTLNESALAYNRQPRLYFNWDKPVLSWLETGVYAEAVRFTHEDINFKYGPEAGPDLEYTRTGQTQRMYGGARLDLKPYVSLPFSGAAWYVTPTLAYRYTAYDLDRQLADSIRRNVLVSQGVDPATATPEQLRGNTSPSRSLPIGSIDAGLFFDRETTIGGRSFLHTLEPRLFYLRTPYRNQDELPIFDTRDFTFSWGQLFRDSRYTGADRQNDANQLTMALGTRFIDQTTGRERFSAAIGQIQYFDESRVTAVPGGPPVEKGKSAWIADANYMVNDRWTLSATYQWDPKYKREDLASFRARYLMPNDGVVNLTYRHRINPDGTDLLKQADLSFLYPLNPRWSLVGRYYYSLEDKKPLEIIGGVQWDSCCLAVRAVARRYVRNREGELNNSIQLEFVLKGLSSLGQDTDRTLRRAILGYNRDDLYLVPPSNTGTTRDDYDPNLIP
ncbi:LPS-assembly protein LptD [Stenotrophomonas maltophilia]|uniref:LPS-assembly protein LptD n=1 Tax=Stenotrophomonas TaxID=40323 RepID=UPI0009B2C9D7|nr:MULTISPECIES: LPS-assembly protein LptD [Stenotrophomonas]MBA0221510.1 LPS-assembly protein LptD [Stenotrophomonas maltophilia]MBE5270382.1 LPS-assembly protein LptD [Stenotrophomonas sp. B2]MBH1593284.1 LPS-assembly protein LptD [Stenotrophomonas maltophilia]MBH1665501.1 LPS-assembly protein LptD [Stenotrophomonas maltophilia]MBN4937828.1 LPS-assembly protein LptD [Stenotrophomonas maltophilia]